MTVLKNLKLEQLQAQFVNSVFTIEKAAGNSTKCSGTKCSDFENSSFDISFDIFNLMVPGGQLTPQQVIEVYRDDYVSRLTGAMADTYPTTCQVIGESAFGRLSALYIDAHPSPFYSLNLYGSSFPQFIKNIGANIDVNISVGDEYALAHEFLSSFPYLGELAEFEQLFTEVFHSRQHTSIEPTEINKVNDLSETIFHLTSSCRFFRGKFSIFKIWGKILDDERERENETDEDNLQPSVHGDHIILYKKEGKVFVRPLHFWQLSLIEKLAQGKNIGECLEESAMDDTDLSSKLDLENLIAELFQFMVHAGLIVRLETRMKN